MDNFTEAYVKAKSIIDATSSWPSEWSSLLAVEAPVRGLFGAEGFEASQAQTPEKLRQAIALKSRHWLIAFFTGGGPR